MPRLSNSEQVTSGYAACWFDDLRTVRNDHGAEIRLSDHGLLAARPCNLVYANGRGDWAAFYSPAGGPSVVFGPNFDLTGAGMPLNSACDPIGPDGSLVYKRSLNSFGPWGFLGGPDFGGDCQQVQNLGQGRVLWLENGILQGRGVEVPAIKCNWPRWKKGHLLYQAETGELVLDGHVIGPTGNYYRPDLFIRTDGTFVIVWARDEGETDIPTPLVLTPAELAALPLYGTVPDPKPDPGPDPQPLPEPTPVSFEKRMPNRKDVVEQVKAAHPEEWAAREDLRFIKRVAWLLHQIDPKFGLLGKRMTDTLAADSIAYLNPTVDPQLPAEMSCEAADVIVGSHSENPQPGWSEITKPVRDGGFGAKWINPQAVDPDPKPVPDPKPTPDPKPEPPPVDLSAVLAELKALRTDVQTIRDNDQAMREAFEALAQDVLEKPPASVTFPNYRGKLPYLGTITLEPVK